LKLACFGLPLAPYLLVGDGHDVRLAVLSPVDAPGMRRLLRTLGPDRVLEASRLGVALDRTVTDVLAREEIDLVLSWFWTRRLPARWIACGRLGGIGAHPSLLPRHRGPNPYYWAIDEGDRTTGVTVHELTERYDDGAVLARATLAVGDRDGWQLARALDRPSIALVREVVSLISRGEPPERVVQAEGQATWAPEPEGDRLRVDFRWPTERVLRRMRALSPVPGVPLDIEGLRLTVFRAVEATLFPEPLEPGEAGVAGEPPVVVIRTGSGAVSLVRATLDPPQGSGHVLEGPELGRVAEEHLRRIRKRGG
jgi:methionyl-tRNA formyltransferase